MTPTAAPTPTPTPAVATAAAAAYSAGADAWAAGPMRVYGRLAALLVARSPVDLRGLDVLDLGAGTGAASSAVRGARRVVGVDIALGMLRTGRATRPPAVAGDAVALPFATAAFDVTVAAFSLNHLADPADGLREVARVSRRYVLASTYASHDGHPARGAVERALEEAGWECPAWYAGTKAAASALGTVGAVTATIEAAGLVPVRVEACDVPFPHLAPVELVRSRLGMPHCAAFVAAGDAAALERRALELLPRDAGPLVRSVIFAVAATR